MIKDTTNFHLIEFRCHCCGAGDDVVSQELLDALQRLRDLWGRPMALTNGYRCPKHNAAVGGAPHSSHMTGEAADIEDADGALDDYCADDILTQCGLWREDPSATSGWCHLQVRPVPNKRTFMP